MNIKANIYRQYNWTCKVQITKTKKNSIPLKVKQTEVLTSFTSMVDGLKNLITAD